MISLRHVPPAGPAGTDAAALSAAIVADTARYYYLPPPRAPWRVAPATCQVLINPSASARTQIPNKSSILDKIRKFFMKIRFAVIQRGTLRFYCGNRLVAALLEQRRRNLEEYPFPSRGTDLPPSYAIKSSFASARRGGRRAAPPGYASSPATTATGAVQITVGAALPRLQSRV